MIVPTTVNEYEVCGKRVEDAWVLVMTVSKKINFERRDVLECLAWLHAENRHQCFLNQ